MLTLLDPKEIDPIAYKQKRLKKIRKFSLLPRKRIGWNYCMDYTWLSMRCEDYIEPGMSIIDIGAGPGAIHGYLENMYSAKIIGLDRDRWEKDYVDFVGDFTDKKVRSEVGIEDGAYDLIISTSSFEHNDYKDHKKLVDVCLKALKPGGRLISTFSAAEREMTYFKGSIQWNLSKDQLETIYKEKFDHFQWREVWERWHAHREMRKAYKKRYGYWNEDSPRFLSAGADIYKK